MNIRTLSRRDFLGHLLLATAFAPLVARAFTDKSRYIMGIDPGRDDLFDQHAEQTIRIQGRAIKVPSNRWFTYLERDADGVFNYRHPVYHGNWDGTFRLEQGCTNPAYILADLYERTGDEPDWIMAFGRRGELITQTPVKGDPSRPFKPRLNWQMLYDWGKWCDEPVDSFVPTATITRSIRMIASTEQCRTNEDLVQLREALRMHCLSWQATDPRYRRSYPVL